MAFQPAPSQSMLNIAIECYEWFYFFVRFTPEANIWFYFEVTESKTVLIVTFALLLWSKTGSKSKVKVKLK